MKALMEEAMLVVWAGVHLALARIGMLRYGLVGVALFTASLLWTELSATLLLLAGWALLKFGYFQTVEIRT